MAASIGPKSIWRALVDDDRHDDDDRLRLADARSDPSQVVARRRPAADELAGPARLSACSSACGDSPRLMASTIRVVEVDADDLVAARGVLHGQRQADVPEPDDGDLHARTASSAGPAIALAAARRTRPSCGPAAGRPSRRGGRPAAGRRRGRPRELARARPPAARGAGSARRVISPSATDVTGAPPSLGFGDACGFA